MQDATTGLTGWGSEAEMRWKGYMGTLLSIQFFCILKIALKSSLSIYVF